jgi:hypothetical protein
MGGDLDGRALRAQGGEMADDVRGMEDKGDVSEKAFSTGLKL